MRLINPNYPCKHWVIQINTVKKNSQRCFFYLIAEYPDPNINDGVNVQQKKKIFFFFWFLLPFVISLKGFDLFKSY